MVKLPWSSLSVKMLYTSVYFIYDRVVLLVDRREMGGEKKGLSEVWIVYSLVSLFYTYYCM